MGEAYLKANLSWVGSHRWSPAGAAEELRGKYQPEDGEADRR